MFGKFPSDMQNTYTLVIDVLELLVDSNKQLFAALKKILK